jgi:hypothetical protein
MNAEHSWADAPTLGVLFETFFYNDLSGYDEHGNLSKTSEINDKPPLPTRLKWDLTNKNLIRNIDEAYSEAVRIINVIMNNLFKYFHYNPFCFRKPIISFTSIKLLEKASLKRATFLPMHLFKWPCNSLITATWENSRSHMKHQ